MYSSDFYDSLSCKKCSTDLIPINNHRSIEIVINHSTILFLLSAEQHLGVDLYLAGDFLVVYQAKMNGFTSFC